MFRWRLSRDTVLFFAGLAGVVHETFLSPVERPWLLAIFGAMMGLPAFLNLDRRKLDEDEE